MPRIIETEFNGGYVNASSPNDDRPHYDWRQQNLRIWEPVINFRTTWKIFVVIGFVFTVLGIILTVIISQQPEDIKISYGNHINCIKCVNKLRVSSNCSKCTENNPPCTCTVQFAIKQNLHLPVYVYYELDNFHQNHRRYVKSKDDDELLGRRIGDVRDACKPYAQDKNSRVYFPCGAIANSMFSDVIKIKKAPENTAILLNPKTIAWTSEKQYKFKNPETNYTEMLKKFNLIKPKDWSVSTYDRWLKDGGLRNERFINWMHPAALPKFRKLYGIIEPDTKIQSCNGGSGILCNGDYELDIEYNFFVANIKSEKTVILSKPSVLGSRNLFIGTLLIVVGVLCLLCGIIFALLNKSVHSRLRVHPAHQPRVSNNSRSLPIQRTLDMTDTITNMDSKATNAPDNIHDSLKATVSPSTSKKTR